LGIYIALLCRLAKPFYRFGIILCHVFAIVVFFSQLDLSGSISLFRFGAQFREAVSGPQLRGAGEDGEEQQPDDGATENHSAAIEPPTATARKPQNTPEFSTRRTRNTEPNLEPLMPTDFSLIRDFRHQCPSGFISG
jgi:hypothetical protein